MTATIPAGTTYEIWLTVLERTVNRSGLTDPERTKIPLHLLKMHEKAAPGLLWPLLNSFWPEMILRRLGHYQLPIVIPYTKE